jgi:hypothetical protein
MNEKLRFLGLDVHAETIAVAVAEPNGEVRSLSSKRQIQKPHQRFEDVDRVTPYQGRTIPVTGAACGRSKRRDHSGVTSQPWRTAQGRAEHQDIYEIGCSLVRSCHPIPSQNAGSALYRPSGQAERGFGLANNNHKPCHAKPWRT